MTDIEYKFVNFLGNDGQLLTKCSISKSDFIALFSNIDSPTAEVLEEQQSVYKALINFISNITRDNGGPGFRSYTDIPKMPTTECTTYKLRGSPERAGISTALKVALFAAMLNGKDAYNTILTNLKKRTYVKTVGIAPHDFETHKPIITFTEGDFKQFISLLANNLSSDANEYYQKNIKPFRLA